MITAVQLHLLAPDTRVRVLQEYRKVVSDPAWLMTYEECAWYYGYKHGTIRCLVARKRLVVCGTPTARRITHSAMRAYIRSKKLAGSPRASQRDLQTRLT